MKASINGKKLIVELDINPHDSKTGKTTVVATSAGNRPTTAEFNGEPVIVGVNAYVRK